MTRFVLALAIAALPLAAQNSSLKGTVTDAQGAAVPGAVVTATNSDTGAIRKTKAIQDLHDLRVQPPLCAREHQRPG